MFKVITSLRLKKLISILFLAALLVQPALIALAAPSYNQQIGTKKAELNDIENELAKLDRDMEITIEQYNLARINLEEAQIKLNRSRMDLAEAEKKRADQQDVLNKRLVSIYKGGDVQIVEVILNTKDFSDLLNRLELLKLISEQDSNLLSKLAAEKDKVAAIEQELEKTNLEAVKIKDEIETKKRETEWMIELKQKRLNSLSADLKELMRKEAARRAAEQAKLINKTKSSVYAKAGTVVATALKYLGIPYVWGGASTRGLDCSGLLKCVFSVHGVSLPHYSGSQFRLGTAVPKENLAPGDAVFFGSPIHHVGIYVGGGNFIHAPRTGDVVRITPLSERTDFAGARRYI